MDIVLGVSMAPSTVQMVLVEGQNGDGATVDEDGFAVPEADGSADQVIAAILGTRESATEGDYRLSSTGVTYTNPVEAAALRDALATHKVENVMLVSAFLAAAALAQAAGNAVGYAHTGLLFVEPDTATLAIVDSADGSIIDVRRQPLHGANAPTEVADLVAGLEAMDSRPDGLFVVGSGVDVAALKPRIETATMLPVSVPDEPETALARGAALASVNAPQLAASTEALAYAQVPDGTAAEVVDSYADDFAYTAASPDFADAEGDSGRKPFFVALGVMTVFFVGVMALVISLAVAIRPSVGERTKPVGNLVAPAAQLPAPAPKAQIPAPPPAQPSKVEQPAPVVQQVPAQAPAPQAPAPVLEAPAAAPAAPAPVPAAVVPAPEAPAPAPQAPPAPAPVPAAPAPAAPIPVPVPIIVPRAPAPPGLPGIFNPPAQNPWQPGGGNRGGGGWEPGGGHGSGGHGGSGIPGLGGFGGGGHGGGGFGGFGGGGHGWGH